MSLVRPDDGIIPEELDSPNDKNGSGGKSKGLSKGGIIGISVAAAVVVIADIVIVVIIVIRKKSITNNKSSTKANDQENAP